MANKRRGRPCKEENKKMKNYMIRLSEQDRTNILRLSTKFDVTRAEAVRIALEMACDSVFPVDDFYIDEIIDEEENEEGENM